MKAARESIAKLGNTLKDLKETLRADTWQRPQTLKRPVGRIYPAALQPSDPAKEALLQELHAQYYEEGFDGVAWELSQLLPETPEEVLESIADRRTLVLEVVGELLSRQVLQNYSNFVQGIDDIAAIEHDLQVAYGIARAARASLKSSQEDVQCSIQVARDTANKRTCGAVLDIAERLQQTRLLGIELKVAQEKHEFAQAFWLCGRSCAWMQDLHQLKVAERLLEHVTQLHKETAGLLGSALQSVCAHFKADVFSEVLEGYLVLGNTSSLGSEVNNAFANALDADALHAMRTAVAKQPGFELRAKAAGTLQDLGKLPTADALCACLQQVMAALFDVMLSHHRMVEWHTVSITGLTATLARLREAKAKLKLQIGTQAVDQPADPVQSQRNSPLRSQKSGTLPSQKSGTLLSQMSGTLPSHPSQALTLQSAARHESQADSQQGPPSTAESLASIQELEAEEQEGGEWCEALQCVQSGLVLGRRLLVENAARKLHVLLAAPNACHRDNIVQVITWARLMVHASDAFCGVTDCGNLMDELGDMGFKYFKGMHSANLDAMYGALERERWQQAVIPPPGETMSSTLPATDAGEQPHTFAQWAAAGNPWQRKHVQPAASSAVPRVSETKGTHGATADDRKGQSAVAVVVSTSQTEEQLGAARAGEGLSSSGRAVAGTAASNQVRRWLIEYAKLLRVMEPTAVLVGGICELFEMYLVFVFRNFSSISLRGLLEDTAAPGVDMEHLPQRLKVTLARILNQSLQAYRGSLLANKAGAASARPTIFGPPPVGARAQPQQATLAVESCQISHPGNLWGLQERLTAAQSLLGLAQELRAAKKQLQRLLSPSQSQALDVFYARTVEASSDVVECVMRAGARLNLAIEELPESIAAHEYNLTEPPDSSASWVEDLACQASLFKDRLQAVPCLDPGVLHQLWCHGMRYAAEIVLSGLSQVKGCSAIGRNAMSSDVQDLGYSLRALLPASPQVAAALDSSLRLLNTYIKAFFLDSIEELHRWVQTHTEYSHTHIQLLAGAIADFRGLKKKERAALMAQV